MTLIMIKFYTKPRAFYNPNVKTFQLDVIKFNDKLLFTSTMQVIMKL